MSYELAFSERFPLDLSKVPKKVRRAYQHLSKSVLCVAPDRANPPQIKRLGSFRNLWRMRVADNYRLVYSVDSQRRTVCLLMLDHRDKIYDRLGADENGEPGFRIIAGAQELIDRELTPEEKALAQELVKRLGLGTKAAPHDRLLPMPLDSATLSSWGIPEDYHNALSAVRTENDLLDQPEVPDEILERIMYCLWPPNIEEVTQKPVRVARDPDHIAEAADGKRSLASFLLMLDEEQLDFLTKFKGAAQPHGPWLLKGGPGSGKSTVTLYCIRELLGSLRQLDLFAEDRPLRILYTTFTKSLERASNHLLDHLDLGGYRNQVEVRTVDSLALENLPQEWKQLRAEQPEEYIKAALDECSTQIPKFSFTPDDCHFLAEEIDWVIIGQGINSLKEYQEFDRAGRGRALGQHQRRHLWQLYEVVQHILRQDGACLFSERLKVASESVSPKYDYVFVDEAQDLKAVAIRFLMGLCHDRRNIFLTADTNQSIWGNGFSWTKMASDLHVQGRARILRRNYRTTREIWQAVLQLAPDSEGADKDTLNVEAVYRGSRPVLARYSTRQQQEKRLNSFLWEALRSERATPSNAAVLCPTEREMNQVVEMLDKKFKAKAMRSRDVDISHPGVKVMTMHAAKGLEFPVVAVVGLEAGRLPLPVWQGIDEEEHMARQKRLLFVACSRAMRRLMVFAHRDRPSPFVKSLSDEYWDIEELC
ncbi:MAG: AAA family ATPase [Firmicutes bacterium]|jgi:superfamily I DNA/RNA helicase/mRNA-degrading endonuclease RelE of RelBE toxin-antitoxin system|nr:AAA family ATPase [Bacillota bacterium]